VQFNRDQLQAFKSQAYVKFWETIAMDRFLDSADIHKKARSKAVQGQLNSCRERIRQLTETKVTDGLNISALMRLLMYSQYAPFDTALQETQEFLTNQAALDFPEVDDEMLLQLSSECEVVKAELGEQRSVISRLKENLEDIWKSDQEALYELTSVFIHRGDSPSWGHYFFYSRHLPDHPDSWFKYNDSDVSVVSKEEVLADTTGSNANPYLVSPDSPYFFLSSNTSPASFLQLVFARKGAEVIQTVKRFDVSSLEEATSS
jgi:ubiquitin carboxyl-terminal hydrolase 25